MQIIQHQELASAQASITFSSIPQTFTDLVLVFSLRASVTDGGLRLRVNGSTANLSMKLLYGTGSSAVSANETNYIGTSTNSGQTANAFANGLLYLSNYASSASKPFSIDNVEETNATAATQWLGAGLYNSSTAITSLELYNTASGNFVQYSSATLYGILKGSSGGVTVS